MSKKTRIIPIGNSKGVRIPKDLLALSQLPDNVEIEAKLGEIRITPSKGKNSETALLSESGLSSDWEQLEEDEAWTQL